MCFKCCVSTSVEVIDAAGLASITALMALQSSPHVMSAMLPHTVHLPPASGGQRDGWAQAMGVLPWHHLLAVGARGETSPAAGGRMKAAVKSSPTVSAEPAVE
jgi:hypothetical protein